MRILIAPDKFKGCLSAIEVAQAIALGVRDGEPTAEIDICPMADGGEGTVAALVAATGGRLVTHTVTGPLPEMKLEATFGLIDSEGTGTTAVIEMAAASGLTLLRPDQYDPLATTTFGTGELIAQAIRFGAKRIILGIGGSATVDAGIGAAQACGFTILMRDGEPTSSTEPLCGRDIENVLMVKHGRGEITNGIEITVACDVTNPLDGDNGAAAVFGPQKGATPDVVRYLDDQLRSLAIRSGKEAEAQQPGAGAAGGLGFGMLAFFGATLKPGFEIVVAAARLRERLAGTDLCITGEGRLDSQSLSGKTVGGVARMCREMRVPCVALVGDGTDAPTMSDLTAWFSIVDGPMTLERAMRDAPMSLAKAARRVVNLTMSSRSH
jgi:glycerate kinase